MSSMEFWGVEVKPGQTLGVKPGDEPGDRKVLHLSQASLGEVKKDKNDSSLLYVKIDGQKLVLGTLSSACTHISYDLVFEKDFELFHTGKTSIHFCGYKAVLEDESNELSDSELDSDEDNVLKVVENGKAELKDVAKPKANATKSDAKKVKIEEPKKDKKPKEDEDEDDEDDDDDDDDDDEDDDESDDGSDDDEDMLDDVKKVLDQGDSDDDDTEDSDEEEEEAPKKGKKRPAESASKATPADKKAKLVTPQKKGADAKKGVAHVSTPHPSKGGKTPATGDNKSKPQAPKSGPSVQCKSCNKIFGSEKGLESHAKAKHGAGN